MKKRRILFLHVTDRDNVNAQSSNVKQILARWSTGDVRAASFHFGDPDPAVAGNPAVDLIKLPSNRSWLATAFLHLQRDWAAVFSPGLHTSLDARAMQMRALVRRQIPIVTTYEGLLAPADDGGELARRYSEAAGHPVYCQTVPDGVFYRRQWMHQHAGRIVAISPFLMRLGQTRYGDKFSTLPLGIDTAVFHPRPDEPLRSKELVVVSAGRVAPHKRPELFLSLAAEYPHVRFRWFGEGEQRRGLIEQAAENGLSNVEFPGSLPPQALARAFRDADVFVLPSRSEGVPKVTQEAAACGLPVIVFGFYETPSVVHGQSGYVVWNDDELRERLVELLSNDKKRRSMGQYGRLLGTKWGWDTIAPSWERLVVSLAQKNRRLLEGIGP